MLLLIPNIIKAVKRQEIDSTTGALKEIKEYLKQKTLFKLSTPCYFITMHYFHLHSWKVSVQEAIQIQERLRKKIFLRDNLPRIQKIAGVDVNFINNEAICAVCVYRYPELSLIEVSKATRQIEFPYVPGLLTFREGPVILEAFKTLKNKPDLVLFDGQGICHPRRMGIATHMGIILDIPSIGCAKSHLYGVYKMPEESKGDFSYIYAPAKGFKAQRTLSDPRIAWPGYKKYKEEILGVVLRTRAKVKPLFISCGYKISLKNAVKLVLELCPKYRIPQPLRCAHHLAGFT